MKEVFRSCLLFFLMALLLLVDGFYAVRQWETYRPPADFKYVEQLEFFAAEPLPSCKVIKKKYKEERYSIAILMLNEDDYQKVLKGIQSMGIRPTLPLPRVRKRRPAMPRFQSVRFER